ncbi:putative nonribosomal peptide synthase [Phialemonium atrogriseum]|uniref:Nonribosomal peptide synthase n=1 Tax=Phialemonium atrogriseum TaxID=1093897 RepID=A0AAJ0C0B5_9PEZI|nr:putative nonribosomal peptide synthase [Phialemonium atrogriseum]KAK1767605.1 putative nonribosomal peptide synthase [Phialemonium atrogriseum]
MQTVGLFLEPLPIRIAFCDSVGDQGGGAISTWPVSCSEYVGAVQSLAQRALSHAIPWRRLLGHLGIKPDELLPDHPLFDCVVSFHDMCSTEQSGSGAWNQLTVGPGVQPQLVWSEGSKFKLMVEFTAISEATLILRLEYDDSCYEGAAHIAAVRRMILRVLEAAITAGGGDERSFEDLREDMKREWQVEEASGFVTESSCGDEARFVAGTDGLFQASLANLGEEFSCSPRIS